MIESPELTVIEGGVTEDADLPGVPAEDPQPETQQVSPDELLVLLTQRQYALLVPPNSAKNRVDRDILRIAAENARFLLPLYIQRS